MQSPGEKNEDAVEGRGQQLGAEGGVAQSVSDFVADPLID
jgi:hypothetical protein